jgi:transposase
MLTEELEASAESAVAKTTTVAAFTRKRPERNTFPEHLPRARGDRTADGV